jgi:hypothetical protein
MNEEFVPSPAVAKTSASDGAGTFCHRFKVDDEIVSLESGS